MSERDAYRRKVEAQVEEYAAKLQALKAKAKHALAEGRIAAHKELDEVEGRLEAARAKLRELGEAGDEAWEKVKSGFESAWGSVTDAWKKVSDRIK